MTGDVELNIVQIITTEDRNISWYGRILSEVHFESHFWSSILYIYICVPN